MGLSPLLRRYDHVILDLDGCVWIGEEPTPGAPEAIQDLRDAGKGVAFATNDPRSSPESYVERLWRLGIRASLDDVVTVGSAVQALLAGAMAGGTALVIGTSALCRHVEEAGLRLVGRTDLAGRADVVVVGGTDEFDYRDLREAAAALRRGADLVATGRDPTYPTPEGLLPGTGAILAAVEYASGRRARIVGKPEPALFATALERLGEGRTLVIGDRLDADVAAAARAGLDSALVLSGGTTREEAEDAGDPTPVAVADCLADLVRGRSG